MVLAIPARDQQGMAMLLEDGFQLALGEWPAELRFLVLDLRADIFRKFVDDVVALRFRKTTSDGFQITIEKFHDTAPYVPKIWKAARPSLPTSSRI